MLLFEKHFMIKEKSNFMSSLITILNYVNNNTILINLISKSQMTILIKILLGQVGLILEWIF